MLDDGRATIDPVAAVDVSQSADFADLVVSPRSGQTANHLALEDSSKLPTKHVGELWHDTK